MREDYPGYFQAVWRELSIFRRIYGWRATIYNIYMLTFHRDKILRKDIK